MEEMEIERIKAQRSSSSSNGGGASAGSTTDAPAADVTGSGSGGIFSQLHYSGVCDTSE